MTTYFLGEKIDTLPCGCRICGRARIYCAAHAPGRCEPERREDRTSILAWLVGDAAGLMAIGLFLACLAVWGQIFADSIH